MTEQSTEPRPKRRVSYNQEAVLCPTCKKRIRLNNDGRLRVHVSGRIGSARCESSEVEPVLQLAKPQKPGHNVFSDIW